MCSCRAVQVHRSVCYLLRSISAQSSLDSVTKFAKRGTWQGSCKDGKDPRRSLRPYYILTSLYGSLPKRQGFLTSGQTPLRQGIPAYSLPVGKDSIKSKIWRMQGSLLEWQGILAISSTSPRNPYLELSSFGGDPCTMARNPYYFLAL